jgi:hypothetical protein
MSSLGRRLAQPLALAFNFSTAVLIIMLNKRLLGGVGFKFPIALTLIHYLVTWIGLECCAVAGVFAKRRGRMTPQLWLLSAAVAGGPALSNISLNLNSVGFYQITKIMVLPACVVGEMIFFGKATPSRARLTALVFVVIGAIYASVNDVQLNLPGSIAAAILIPCAAIYKSLWSHVSKEGAYGSLELMQRILPWSTLWVALATPFIDDFAGLRAFDYSLSSCTLLFLSGALAFLINWSVMMVLGMTSALTHILLGQLKTCTIILLGSLLFHTQPTLKSLVGSAVVVVAVTAYTYVNVQEQQRASQSQQQRVFASDPKSGAYAKVSDNDDDGGSRDGGGAVAMTSIAHGVDGGGSAGNAAAADYALRSGGAR